ncbi:C48 family peptidase [Bradyrhizobium sp. CCGUVB4N]|uniref:Ulp1 family isopeptidase n=1 Tax=Bradyrhizobium sp. CCGUVB4N TaxID=2949631 RepID=UPI0020B442C0|nr:Ulp1 family isopeptidase [Bradyrhizobium sp. CCGUVB4N]MCP3380409.1 C48 family peptidase [Bradyrhizobium sp. CCGUVB4N]
MDANNFNPFDVSGRPEAHHATLQQPQAGQAGQEDFERRLVEVRQTDVAAAAGATPDSRYPHLTEKDRTLIEAVAEHFAGNLQSHTVGNYTWALRALGNHLSSRGQTIDALDHDSLVWHASAFFPTDGSMGNALSALNALRKYREPKASDSSRRYAPSLEDASLIDSAIGAAAARRRWTPTTAVNYESTLRRLAKSLESQGQTIAALDHNSLVAHVKQSFGDNGNMASALEVLRECREPDILAARVPRQRDEYVPSMEDKALIDSAVLASGRPEHTVKHYTGKLYRFAGVLKNDGHGIAKLDHESLIRLAKGLYSRNKNLITGLNIIRDYRNAQGPAGAGSVQSPVQNVNSRELLLRLDDQPAPARSMYDSAELRGVADQTGRLPAGSLDTAELMAMLASPTRSPGDSVDQPSPAFRSSVQAVAPDEIAPAGDRTGQLPAESLDPVELLAMLASPTRSLGDGVDQPSPVFRSPIQAVAPDKIGPAADGTGRLPAESLDTVELLGVLASPTHSPGDSVNQPNSSPLWNMGEATSGPVFLPVHAPLTAPNLDSYLPLVWQTPAGWDGPWSGPSSQSDQSAGSQTVSYDQDELWRDAEQAGWRAPAGWDAPQSGLSSQSDQSVRSDTTWAPQMPSNFDWNLFPEGRLAWPPSTPQELGIDANLLPAFLSTTSDALKAPSPDRSGRVLDTREWLGDRHILRDYELLMQDLQRSNPDLAARTRLVDPLIAHYQLRLGPEDVMLATFQRIVEVDGNDTADFLFMPVSDASASDPARRGTHWSLLFVDRRERERPVAYHYDSHGGQNDGLAEMLAQRLTARLEPVRMAQQRNDFDCGVFVVDGTRALVSRLSERWQPAGELHLDNLVADRLALRNRLRG